MRNRVKYSNVAPNKLIYNLQTRESVHFEDSKLEESSPRLLNMLLISFQGFKGVLGPTHLCHDLHNHVEGA